MPQQASLGAPPFVLDTRSHAPKQNGALLYSAIITTEKVKTKELHEMIMPGKKKETRKKPVCDFVHKKYEAGPLQGNVQH